MKKRFNFEAHHLELMRKLARRLHVDLSDPELIAIAWMSALPDIVQSGAGEKEGLVLKRGGEVLARPDVFELVFDPANLLAARFWAAYIREPEAVARLILEASRAQRRDRRELASLDCRT